MSTFEFDELTALNPLPAHVAERLDLVAAERELLERITSRPAGIPARGRAPGRRRFVSPRRLGVLIAAAAAVLVLFAILPSDHQDGGPQPAFAAELVRFANASPLVLLDEPGWHAYHADEETRQMGEIDYRRGGQDAELKWQDGSLRRWVADRAGQSSHSWTVQILGTTTRVFQYAGAPHEFSAVWGLGGRLLEFDAQAADTAAFESQLRSLRRVGATTWLRALPTNVVQTADRGKVVQQMLKGIPLPPGFDAAQIRGAGLVRNRYQLGTAVTGTVACEWFGAWARGRADGNQAAVNRAIAAMATASHWPVVHQLRHSGAWPQVLLQMAGAMPAATLMGRPLLQQVDPALGCSYEWGIRMSAPGRRPRSRGRSSSGTRRTSATPGS
jgi:hypothetical protein